jgi:hypothetical protein
MRLKKLGLPSKDSFFQTHFIHWMNILTIPPIKVSAVLQVGC